MIYQHLPFFPSPTVKQATKLTGLFKEYSYSKWPPIASTAFQLSVGNLSNSSPAIFSRKTAYPKQSKTKTTKTQRSLGIYLPAHSRFPEETLLERLTTHENHHRTALQLGREKGKSAEASSDSQSTHNFFSGITTLVRVMNFYYNMVASERAFS